MEEKCLVVYIIFIFEINHLNFDDLTSPPSSRNFKCLVYLRIDIKLNLIIVDLKKIYKLSLTELIWIKLMYQLLINIIYKYRLKEEKDIF